MDSFVRRLIDVTPEPRQLAWQQLEFTAFFHFGMNTFTDREWGDGNESESLFNPTSLDTDQWCEAVKNAGIKACIITAKHHDGFCLFNSQYTEHCVRNSPFKGDVVAMLSKSCAKYGLKLGIYLSPWDRNNKSYGKGEEYDRYFCNQLTELLSNYGDIYTVWFDGACGEGENGLKQEYDWNRYYNVIRKLQPEAVISVCGPDVRWCGNEAGTCRESEWSVVSSALCDNEKIGAASQQRDDAAFREKPVTSSDADLGSREALANAKALVWYPAEVDTSIRPGWFYHTNEDDKVRSLDTLINIYLNSVGGNSVLLLNIPPDTRGKISDADVTRLSELGSFIRDSFSNNVVADAHITASSTFIGSYIENILTTDDSFWMPDEAETAEIELVFENDFPIAYVTLMEQTEKSQRIEEFSLLIKAGQDWEEVYHGTTVGYKKICKLSKPAVSREWKLKIEKSRFCPTLKYLAFHPQANS